MKNLKNKLKQNKPVDKFAEGRKLYLAKIKSGEVEIVHLDPMEKSEANPKSMKYAIRAKCFDCNCGEAWVNRTRFCTIFGCPLWKVRPFRQNITEQMCRDYVHS